MGSRLRMLASHRSRWTAPRHDPKFYATRAVGIQQKAAPPQGGPGRTLGRFRPRARLRRMQIFTDNDGEWRPLYVNSIQLWNRALSFGEILAVGRPSPPAFHRPSPEPAFYPGNQSACGARFSFPHYPRVFESASQPCSGFAKAVAQWTTVDFCFTLGHSFSLTFDVIDP